MVEQRLVWKTSSWCAKAVEVSAVNVLNTNGKTLKLDTCGTCRFVWTTTASVFKNTACVFENSVVDQICNLVLCKLLFFRQNLHVLFWSWRCRTHFTLVHLLPAWKVLQASHDPMANPVFLYRSYTGVSGGKTYKKILQPCFIVESEVQSAHAAS